MTHESYVWSSYVDIPFRPQFQFSFVRVRVRVCVCKAYRQSLPVVWRWVSLQHLWSLKQEQQLHRSVCWHWLLSLCLKTKTKRTKTRSKTTNQKKCASKHTKKAALLAGLPMLNDIGAHCVKVLSQNRRVYIWKLLNSEYKTKDKHQMVFHKLCIYVQIHYWAQTSVILRLTFCGKWMFARACMCIQYKSS